MRQRIETGASCLHSTLRHYGEGEQRSRPLSLSLDLDLDLQLRLLGAGPEIPNWELKKCCNHDQVVFLTTIAVGTVLILAASSIVLSPSRSSYRNNPFSSKLVTVFLHEASHAIACKLTCGQVEGIQVHADEGGVTQTRGGIYWLILPAGYLGSSIWGMVLILASTNLLTDRIAAGCFAFALVVMIFIAKNWTLRWLGIGFIIFLAVIWVMQETTKIRILRYIILFAGVMNSLFSVYGIYICADIYDQVISRRDTSSDAEKFAEVCPCPCNGVGWGVIWGFISFLFLCGAMYLGLVILSLGKNNVGSQTFNGHQA
ncbi:uncharacterized protein LOC130767566 [Actinidia eriantha]|uniref:uncharacterized protein LOC130767566 n=1 Tax=Actinidia eriantha TaxID=165200 RepID=UPI00258DE05F|nr:uncharacterized protein LOC130767566 [Actinidia eriantha]